MSALEPFPASAVAIELTRTIFRVWADKMYAVMESRAQLKWGNEWLSNCRKYLSDKMQKMVQDEGWDAYRVTTVHMANPAVFYPSYTSQCDSKRELYRNRLHHIKFLRDKLAHFPRPSIAECIAGVMAMQDVIKENGLVDSEAEFHSVRRELQELFQIPHSEPKEKMLSSTSVVRIVADLVLEEFSLKISKQVASHWKSAPITPIDISRLCGILCPKEKETRNRNPNLTSWKQYWDRFSDIETSIDAIRDYRNELNHDWTADGIDFTKSCELIRCVSQVLKDLSIESSNILHFESHLKECEGQTDHSIGIAADADVPSMSIAFDTANLIGRDDLINQIRADMLSSLSSTSHLKVVLTGPSGIGKTVLARKVCNSLNEKFPFQILLVGTSFDFLRLELARVGRAFSSGVCQETKEEDAVELGRKYLSIIPGTLVLLDDVVDPIEISPILPECHIIFTSHNHNTWADCKWLTGSYIVNKLSTDHCLDLLASDCNRRDRRVRPEVLNDPEVGMREFVEKELGNLPLAVAMLKSAFKGLALDNARGLMKSIRENPVTGLEEFPVERYLRSLPCMTIELIESRLRERCRLEDGLFACALDLLAVFCISNPVDIPDGLFWHQDMEGPANFGKIIVSTPEQFFRACKVLVEVGLVMRDAGRAFTLMHPLYQKCVFCYFTRGKPVSLHVWGKYLNSLRQYWRSVRDLDNLKAKLGLWYPTVLFIVEASLESSSPSVRSSKLCFLDLTPEYASELMKTAGAPAIDLFCQLDFAKRCFSHVLQVQMCQHGCQSVSVAVTEMDIGNVHQALGQYEEALVHLNKALKINVSQLGNDHVSVSATKVNIANVYQAQGRYEEALKEYEESLEIDIKCLGNDHVSVASTKNNIAMVYDSLGKYEEALKMYEEALEIKVKCLGNDHVSVASTYCNMGVVYKSLGQYDKALEMYQKDLEISIKCLGNNHVFVASTKNNVAVVYKSLGKYEEALKTYEEALEINIKCLGYDHVSVASTKHNIGEVYRQQGKYEEALKMYEGSLAVTIKCIGNNHVSVSATKVNIANVYQAQGRYEEALKEYEESLEINITCLGNDHVSVAETKGNISNVHQVLGRYEEALKMLEGALQIFTICLGNNHVLGWGDRAG